MLQGIVVQLLIDYCTSKQDFMGPYEEFYTDLFIL